MDPPFARTWISNEDARPRGRGDLLVARRTPRRRALRGLFLLRLAFLLQRLAGRRLGALGTALVLVGHSVSFPKEGLEATVSPSRKPFEPAGATALAAPRGTARRTSPSARTIHGCTRGPFR